MIKGIKYWKHSTIRYDQTRNSVEAIIKKVLAENGRSRGWLESCGASAFSTIAEGMGFIDPADYPGLNGQSIQFDDFVTIFLNDPKRDSIFSTGTSFDNRAMRNYQRLAKIIFPTCQAVYKIWNWKELTAELYEGNGVQMCLRSPGHYIAGIAYDKNANEILYSDSWGSRKGLKNGGWQERLTEKEYNKNCMGYAVVYREV